MGAAVNPPAGRLPATGPPICRRASPGHRHQGKHAARWALAAGNVRETRNARTSSAVEAGIPRAGHGCTGGPRALRRWLVNGGTLRFAAIPRGTFRMGCTARGRASARKTKRSREQSPSGPFQMSVTEVTQALWEATMGENPSDFQGPQQPVENVSWQDAKKFVDKLNQRGDGFTYRLPHGERNGSMQLAPMAVPPEQLASVAWFGLLASVGQPRPVLGMSPGNRPNACGLFDMLGNVAEWCEDWFSPNYQRVLRGGAWTDSATSLRLSARGKAVPTTRTYSIGVRVVQNACWAPRSDVYSSSLSSRTSRPRTQRHSAV